MHLPLSSGDAEFDPAAGAVPRVGHGPAAAVQALRVGIGDGLGRRTELLEGRRAQLLPIVVDEAVEIVGGLGGLSKTIATSLSFISKSRWNLLSPITHWKCEPSGTRALGDTREAMSLE